MLLGCGGSRKAAVEREVVRMDSLSVVRRDSLWMVRRLEASVGRLLEVRHVTFAPPDTSGVQHVASLTLATSASGGQYAAGEAARSGSETEAAVRSEAEVAERVRTARRRPRFPYVLLLAGILGFALLRSVKK